MRFLSCLLIAGWAWTSLAGTDNLATNGGFEADLTGWRSFWCRQPGQGSVALDSGTARTGTQSARIDHRGSEDWSLEPDLRVSVRPGDVFELEAWLRIEGAGSATLCASTWDAQGRNVAWSEAERTAHATPQWTRLRTRFVVPPGVAQIQPRLIGYGAATVWVDDYSVVQMPAVATLRVATGPWSLTNAALVVDFDPTNATCAVLDRRTGRRWRQQPTHADVVVTRLRASENQLDIDLMDVPLALTLTARLRLDPVRPEFTLQVEGAGEMASALRFPFPFVTDAGDRLVVPMNEGISYPVEDGSIEPFRLIAYGGHGICMAFWGVTDGQQGHAALIETADDAAIRIQRLAGRLVVAPEWDAQRGQVGYGRQLRYVFFDHGGHVAMAKRYREYAQQTGRFKTLAEKRRENPEVDRLIGAVNVWNWDREPVELVREMQTAGIRRILWSRGGTPAQLQALNELQVLTSRYDLYQDIMDPANFPKLNGTHGDWVTAAWPKDIILRADGDWLRGWGVKGKAGEWYSCAVICDSRALDYARQRISAELATHPYLCRFIDTTTAAPWNECYHTNHPMTRTQSREWKMRLLELVSHEMKLVTGCETGHDAAVPYLHYFEGMLSLGPYRVPDAGRDMARLWTELPERVVKFQLGQAYRLPLWELVYHDCVVAQWYWGDYNNKLPALWQKRDLFNLLYGTPPMFMFTRAYWESQKDRFVRSYQTICPTVRAVGYSEMTDHRFLTPDRNVQQTVFDNGVTVTVNFGETEYHLTDGRLIRPMGFDVQGVQPQVK